MFRGEFGSGLRRRRYEIVLSKKPDGNLKDPKTLWLMDLLEMFYEHENSLHCETPSQVAAVELVDEGVGQWQEAPRRGLENWK